MISQKANDEFWKSVTVPIDKNVTMKLINGDMVIEKKDEHCVESIQKKK